MIHKEELKQGFELHTIWQTCKEGVPEAAINVRDYNDGEIIEIRQGKKDILVNIETLPELIKVLQYYQRKGKE